MKNIPIECAHEVDAVHGLKIAKFHVRCSHATALLPVLNHINISYNLYTYADQ